MLPDEMRQINLKSKLFFMFTIGVHKALHNANWAIRCNDIGALKGLEIYIAIDVCQDYIHTIPIILVSTGDFYRIRDPHIKEHTWKKISMAELEHLLV